MGTAHHQAKAFGIFFGQRVYGLQKVKDALAFHQQPHKQKLRNRMHGPRAGIDGGLDNIVYYTYVFATNGFLEILFPAFRQHYNMVASIHHLFESRNAHPTYGVEYEAAVIMVYNFVTQQPAPLHKHILAPERLSGSRMDVQNIAPAQAKYGQAKHCPGEFQQARQGASPAVCLNKSQSIEAPCIGSRHRGYSSVGAPVGGEFHYPPEYFF